MDGPTSNQPNCGQGGGLGGLFLMALGLAVVIPVVAFVVLWVGLFLLCVAFRWAALLGLVLAVACVIFAVVFLTDPEMGDMAPVGLLFLPWAGFGVWLAVGGFSKQRGLPHDPSA